MTATIVHSTAWVLAKLIVIQYFACTNYSAKTSFLAFRHIQKLTNQLSMPGVIERSKF